MSRNLVRPISAFALAIVSCLAIVGAGASTASAFSVYPESDEFPAEFSVSGGYFVAEAGYYKYVCTGGTTGSGSMQGPTTGIVTLEFHECTGSENHNCTSEGAEKGTIVTKPLAVDLVNLPEEEERGGILFDPLDLDSTFAEFHCWVIPVTWTGSVIGEITSPDLEEEWIKEWLENENPWDEFKFKFREQGPTETYRGQEAHLTEVRGIHDPEDLAFTASGDLDFEELLLFSADEGPGLTPSTGGFPASISWPFEEGSGGEVVLRAGLDNITCAESEVSGSGEFADPASGDVAFTLHKCTEELGFNCTSAGQEKGTIKTESLPVEFNYLSDGTPGVTLKANETSDKVMEVTCFFINFVVSGSVLGSISEPDGLGEVGWVLSTEMNVIEEGKDHAQEYTETEAGIEHGLEVEIAGEEAEPASLGMSANMTPVNEEEGLLSVRLGE